VACVTYPLYRELMTLISILRAIRRKLTPPGNRGSLETDHQQPNGSSDIIGTGIGENMRDVGNMSGGAM
jgi:hypothetical protein